MSHIPKFGDASKSPAGDTVSLAGDAAFPSGDAVVSHWRCIKSFRDAHPAHSHPYLPQETPHLPREMYSHLQIAGYVTLLFIVDLVYFSRYIRFIIFYVCAKYILKKAREMQTNLR